MGAQNAVCFCVWGGGKRKSKKGNTAKRGGAGWIGKGDKRGGDKKVERSTVLGRPHLREILEKPTVSNMVRLIITEVYSVEANRGKETFSMLECTARGGQKGGNDQCSTVVPTLQKDEKNW